MHFKAFVPPWWQLFLGVTGAPDENKTRVEVSSL